jgi:thymidylate kinase
MIIGIEGLEKAGVTTFAKQLVQTLEVNRIALARYFDPLASSWVENSPIREGWRKTIDTHDINLLAGAHRNTLAGARRFLDFNPNGNHRIAVIDRTMYSWLAQWGGGGSYSPKNLQFDLIVYLDTHDDIRAERAAAVGEKLNTDRDTETSERYSELLPDWFDGTCHIITGGNPVEKLVAQLWERKLRKAMQIREVARAYSFSEKPTRMPHKLSQTSEGGV